MTAEKVTTIIAGVRRGMSTYGAAAYVGVYKQLIHYWLQRGEQLDIEEIDPSRLSESERLYVALARGVTLARGEVEWRQVARIDAAGEDDWHAAAWLLSRRFPELYSPRQLRRSEVTVSHVEQPEPDTVTPEDRIAALVELGRRAPALPAPPANRCAHGLADCPTCNRPPPLPRDPCAEGEHELSRDRMRCVRCGTAWSRPR